MSMGANVRSVDALKDFKVTLINFAEEARIALSSADMEIRQVRNWLTRDQLSYWQSQVKRCQERVSIARTELHRRQLSQANSDAVSDTDQKEALRDAQRRLREAEEKVEKIKRWVPVLEHAISEYNSQSQPLGDRLAGSFTSSLKGLDRMIAALDSYLAMAPPTAPVVPKAATSESMSESTSTSSSAAATAKAGEATTETGDGSPPAETEGEAPKADPAADEALAQSRAE